MTDTRYTYQYRKHGKTKAEDTTHDATRAEILARLTLWRGYPDSLPVELLHNLEHLVEHGAFYRLAPYESYRVDLEEGTDHPAPYEPFFDDPGYATPETGDGYGNPWGDIE